MKRAWMALAVVAALALPALAGDGLQERPQAPMVSLEEASPVSVPVGGSALVKLTFRVGQGFHINSNKPNTELQIPTTLKLSPPNDLGIGRVTFPAGHDLTFSFAPDVKLNVYTGDFTVTARVAAVRTAAPGGFTVHGELTYQACDDRLCYPPKTLPVAFNVKVVRR